VDSAASAATTVDQPQAEVEVSSQKVESIGGTKTAGKSCHLARAAAPNGVGPPCAGGSRTGRGQISTDPANPTILPPINGVTVGIYIVTLPNGDEEVHYQIISGTFAGTDAIDLKVKSSPGVFTCQVTNAAPTGSCPALVNQNSGKGHVDIVDLCPGSTTVPPVNPPPSGGGPGSGGSGGVAGANGKGGSGPGNGGKNVAGAGGSGGNSPSVAAASVAASSVAAPSGELPVTGAQVLWLILGGIMLLGVGATLRTRLN
jgi:hypothetical protein